MNLLETHRTRAQPLCKDVSLVASNANPNMKNGGHLRT